MRTNKAFPYGLDVLTTSWASSAWVARRLTYLADSITGVSARRVASFWTVLCCPHAEIRAAGSKEAYSEDWWAEHSNENRCVAHRKER